jgi:hypothetical protein
MKFVEKILVVAFLLFWSVVVSAATLEEKKQIILQSASGEPVTIATAEFSKLSGGGYSYTVEMVEDLYSDHFLSMRPFKCFTAPKQMLCHLAYPYPKTQKITSSDLQDLEYDLLFIHRKGADYGINPWNGIYYKLTLHSDGTITGVLTEVDLDILAVPPEPGVIRPITASDLNEADPASHAFPTLIIK